MKNLTKKQIKEKDDHARNLMAALDWLQNIVVDQEDYISERSDAWQESAQGENYTSWAETFSSLANTLDEAASEFDNLEVEP